MAVNLVHMTKRLQQIRVALANTVEEACGAMIQAKAGGK